MSQPTHSAKPGFRLGIYVFKDAEIVDFAAPYGVSSVARRYDPELDVFLIADIARTMEKIDTHNNVETALYAVQHHSVSMAS